MIGGRFGAAGQPVRNPFHGALMSILSRLASIALRIAVPGALVLVLAACASTDGTRPIGLTVSKNMNPPGTIPR